MFFVRNTDDVSSPRRARALAPLLLSALTRGGAFVDPLGRRRHITPECCHQPRCSSLAAASVFISIPLPSGITIALGRSPAPLPFSTAPCSPVFNNNLESTVLELVLSPSPFHHFCACYSFRSFLLCFTSYCFTLFHAHVFTLFYALFLPLTVVIASVRPL